MLLINRTGRGVSQKERPPKVTTTKIRIVIRSFDHPFLENHFGGLQPDTRKIGLPESRVLYTVLRSPHIDKKSREQFEMEIKKKFLIIKTEKHELRKKFFRLKRRFPFRFTECDLGHDGGLRASVGKRSPEYSTRSPFFFLLPWGRPVNKGGDLEAIPVEVSPMTDFCIRGYVGSQLGKRDLSGGRKGEKTRGGIFYPTICVMKSFETAESTIHSLSGLDTSVSLLTQAPLVDYRNLPRLALIYEVPFLRSVRGVVFFRVGQPLGFLSSWPLFTLTHHLVMFYCEEKVYPGQRLTRYAILGDDVCIADENVASLYRQTVNDLGLAIRRGVR
ncbi:hypothetical protein V8G54_000196 (mitochondrion) [Vigna mungo]|uniref:Small ribosomal subunit protein uS10 domain-containing protein n=1 Tax=Vigna mungo TaxID=3915 RepID=A0AAQ3PFX1_VIGMU